MDCTLVLNASYEPLRVVSWQRAVTLTFLGKVEVVEEYEREIHSVSMSMRMPAVVRLLCYVRLQQRKPPLTKHNVLARDNYQCQYCRQPLTPGDCTIDHVIPRSQGGTTTWSNVAAACYRCTRRQGGCTPKEAGMKLIREPVEPHCLPVLCTRSPENLPDSWYSFLNTSAQRAA